MGRARTMREMLAGRRWALWWVATIMVLVVHHCNDAEASGLPKEVFLLEEEGSAIKESGQAHSFLQMAGGVEELLDAGTTNSTGNSTGNSSATPAASSATPAASNATPATPAASNATTAAPQGSAAGSAAFAFNPQPLRKPYHKHMDHNKDMWSSLGGWNTQNEKQVQLAKQDLNLAVTYAKKKNLEKEISELGCPCEGEKYYDLVSKMLAGPGSGAGMEFESASGSGAGASGSGAGKEDGGRISSKEFKRMLKKYGKLGPNSTWKPKHDQQKRKAKKELRKAELIENAAFKTALPEFRKLKQDDPAFFTNGKCPCPQGWTPQLAHALSARMSKDKEDEYWQKMHAHRANMAQMSGEADRIAAQEAAGEPPDHEMP